MGGNLDRFNKWRRSLSVRLTSMFVVSGLLIMLIVVPIVYYWFHDRMIKEYVDMAQGLTRLMGKCIDGERVDDFISNSRQLEDYEGIRRQLCDIKENYPDVLYAHVIRFQAEGGIVAFNMQDSG